ncbi:MAG: ABC transporter substrate-binding protein [Chloroflexi bacterium]|nr:MAG: ABC transporter substrate-binding protein [Chloroflexota bacterium]
MTWKTSGWILVVLLAVFSVSAIACVAPPAGPAPAGPTEAPAAPVAEEAITRANTLVYATDISDLITLDAAVIYEFSGILVGHAVYDTLVAFEGEDLSTLKPRLAESWDIEDAGDHWEVTFKLRQGVKFSNGHDFDAGDVIYSFRRVLALNKSPAFLFSEIAGLTEDSFSAPDPYTVVISMPKSASPQALLSVLTFTIGGIVDEEEAKAHEQAGDWGSAWLLDHSAGTGPYVIERWDRESEVVLKANPNYWGTPPAMKQVIIKHVPETTNQKFMLESGDADVARDLTPEQVADIRGKPGLKIYQGRTLLLIYVGMNVGVPPLDKPQVREAIRWAIDYDGIVNDLLQGNALKVQTIIPKGLLGYNPDTPFSQDFDKAKALLEEAGVTTPVDLEMLVATGPAPGGIEWADLAAKLQNDLAQIGINVHIKQTTQAELLNIYRDQKGELVQLLWGPDFPDPDGNVGPFTDYKQKALAYRNKWDDPEIAAKGRRAALETDPAKREALYKEITEYVLHNGPYVVLYQPTINFGLREDIEGFVWNPMGWVEFADVRRK